MHRTNKLKQINWAYTFFYYIESKKNYYIGLEQIKKDNMSEILLNNQEQTKLVQTIVVYY